MLSLTKKALKGTGFAKDLREGLNKKHRPIKVRHNAALLQCNLDTLEGQRDKLREMRKAKIGMQVKHRIPDPLRRHFNLVNRSPDMLKARITI